MSRVERIRVVEPTSRVRSLSGMITEAARVSSPMTRFGAQFAALADWVYMSDAHCLMYVARRVAEARNARARAGWVGGRFYNRLTGSKTDYVVLSGTVLANSLKWLGEIVPEDFPRAADLVLQFDIAEKLDADLRAKAAAEGMTNAR